MSDRVSHSKSRASYGEARPIGRMVPHTQRLEPPASAECERCACKLSRYRDHWQHHCLTCQQILVDEGALRVPAFEPADTSAEQARKAATKPAEPTRHRQLSAAEKESHHRYDACHCGRGMKRTDRRRCRACYNDARRVPGAKWSATCACGGKKSKGSEMCMKCRYGIIAA